MDLHARNELDPRTKHMSYNPRSKPKEYDFSITQFVIDSNYIGDPPHVQVSIDNLNDNIDENFLRREVSRLGPIRNLEIVRHPRTLQHLGMAKIQFEDTRTAQTCVETFHGKQMMGRQLQAFKDVRFAIIEKIKEEKLNPRPQPVPTNRGRLDDRIANMMKQPNSILSSLVSSNVKQNNLTPTPAIISTPTILPQRPTPSTHIQIPPKELPRPPSRSPVDEDSNENGKSPNKNKISEPFNPIITENQIYACLEDFFSRFKKELTENVDQTVFKKLRERYAYKVVETSQQAYKKKQDEIKIQQDKENLEKELQKLFERRSRVERAQEQPRPRANLMRQRNTTEQEHRVQGEVDLRRVNRSSAFIPEVERRGRSMSEVSDISEEESLSSASSRSSSVDYRYDTSVGSSRSASSFSSPSQSRSASASRSGSRSRSDSRSGSSSPDIREQPILHPRVPSPSINGALDQRTEDERAAVVSLLGFTSSKKRKQVCLDEPEPKKFAPDYDYQEFPERSTTLKQQMLDDLFGTLKREDIKYLAQIHADYTKKRGQNIPFGSMEANESHLDAFADSKLMIEEFRKEEEPKKRLKPERHPKWWRGCSRCDPIEISEKEKVDEDFVDLNKAPIKSHTSQMQALTSRRDLRGDQRRIAALNPNIDIEYIKVMTTKPNTLQMRAKNLRFSRSKIHKWGLFACEKIAMGDAVIEYVGEKIRPSLADHREKVVYTNLPTHDGSSYFFRVDTDVIDATLKGNKARFINHSCNPNCIAKVIKHDNGTNSIVIYAKQSIQEDEEITYDYKFPREETEEKIRCNCRAPNCQKYLN